jgi:hypothetical protein
VIVKAGIAMLACRAVREIGWVMGPSESSAADEASFNQFQRLTDSRETLAQNCHPPRQRAIILAWDAPPELVEISPAIPLGVEPPRNGCEWVEADFAGCPGW